MSIKGEIPSSISPPLGCRFHARCSVETGKMPRTKESTLIDVGDGLCALT